MFCGLIPTFVEVTGEKLVRLTPTFHPHPRTILNRVKSIRMKPGKVNQSKIALEINGDVQFEPKTWKSENAKNFKDLYSDLAGNLVRTLPVALNKFNNNSTKQYYMNIETSYHWTMQCNTWKYQKPLVWKEYPQNIWKMVPEVSPLPRCNLVNLLIKQTLFPN